MWVHLAEMYAFHYSKMSVCVRVCVCACVRACVRVFERNFFTLQQTANHIHDWLD